MNNIMEVLPLWLYSFNFYVSRPTFINQFGQMSWSCGCKTTAYHHSSTAVLGWNVLLCFQIVFSPAAPPNRLHLLCLLLIVLSWTLTSAQLRRSQLWLLGFLFVFFWSIEWSVLSMCCRLLGGLATVFHLWAALCLCLFLLAVCFYVCFYGGLTICWWSVYQELIISRAQSGPTCFCFDPGCTFC